MRRGDLRRALALVRRRTQRGEALRVRLMERPGCELCAEAYRALRRISLERPIDIERVDITAGPDVAQDRYLLRIPVLVAGGEELDAAGLEDGAISRWLNGLPALGHDPQRGPGAAGQRGPTAGREG